MVAVCYLGHLKNWLIDWLLYVGARLVLGWVTVCGWVNHLVM